MLQALSHPGVPNSSWLQPFVSDFKSRFIALLAGAADMKAASQVRTLLGMLRMHRHLAQSLGLQHMLGCVDIQPNNLFVCHSEHVHCALPRLASARGDSETDMHRVRCRCFQWHVPSAGPVHTQPQAGDK